MDTAVPQYAMQQSDIKQFAAGLSRLLIQDDRMVLNIFDLGSYFYKIR